MTYFLRPIAACLAFSTLAAALTATVAVQPAVAQDVIRPGDSAMTCEALAREINDLSRQQVREVRATAPRPQGQAGQGGFGSLLRGLRPVLDAVVSETGGETMAAAAIARSAIDSAPVTSSSPPTTLRTAPVPAVPPTAAPSLASLRSERLNGLHAARGC